MIEEKQGKKKRGKKEKGEESDKDFEEFLDDVENDPHLRKNVKLYKNQEVLGGKDLKHMNKEQLDELLGEIEIEELLDDMNIDEKPNTYENDVEGIDELVKGMTNLTFKEGEDYDRAQRNKKLNS